MAASNPLSIKSAAGTTLAFAVPQLRAPIEAGLSVGATHEQIVETILQMTFYAGGAATSNAMRTAADVFREIAEIEATD
jgi:4-carboxymuconolactone decarboxylase